MINDIEKISEVSNVKLRLRKRLTMKGLYYKEMIKRIENPKKIKKNTFEDTTKEEIASTKHSPLSEEGNFLDKLV